MIRKVACLIISIASFDVLAQSVEPQGCPKAVDMPIRFPPAAIKSNFNGEVTVAARFDNCGRVLETALIKKSKLKSINDAVLDALKLTVLSDAQRSNAIDGWYYRTVAFGVDNSVKFVSLDWPKTHANPQYLRDDSPLGYDSVQQASNAVQESVPKIIRPPVYEFVHRIVQYEAPTGREFWLFISTQTGPTAAAVRYRPVFENNQPVVKLAMLCELQQSQCDSLRDILMRGLPFAKAKK
jgi:hypothetical protein